MSSLQGPGGTTLYIKQISASYYYSTNNVSYTTFSFPATVTNTNTAAGVLKVIFITNLTLTVETYFTCASSDIQFGSTTLNTDGTRPTITISGVSNFSGFIRNGALSSGYANVSIYNLVINAVGSTLAPDCGWLTYAYFSRGAANNLISNCSTNGDIVSGGGICGSYAAIGGGSLTIQYCTTSGNISTNGGGIIGIYCAINSGCTITITNCSSTGTIGNNCGGMTGYGCGASGTTITATNCYSTGSITNGGGIFGTNTAGSSSAENCYSTGLINGGGGIYANGGGASGGSASAINCFTTGDITNNAGGIYGSSYNATGASAYNCYTTGLKSGPASGGIWYNSSSDTVQGVNNWAEGNHSSSGWNDTNASRYLSGAPSGSLIGTIWVQLNGINTAYILKTSGYSPYSTTLGITASSSIAAGSSTTAAVVPGYTFSLLAVNTTYASSFPTLTLGSFTIDTSTGSITADISTVGSVYTILIYSSINPYSITTYTLTVAGAPTPSVTTDSGSTSESVSCCSLPIDLNTQVDYETRNNFATGNTMIGGIQNRQPYASYTMLLYKKMAFAGKR